MTDQRPENRHRRQIAERLFEVLADSYLLYHTTQSCHWNVVGHQFRPLHEMFEEQYRALADAIDVIAERIRVLGFFTPGTLHDFMRLSRIEQPANVHRAERMLEQLIDGHDKVAERIRGAIVVAQKAEDEATVDLLVERLRAHEKMCWVLKSQAGHVSGHLDLERMARGSDTVPKLARAGGA